MEAVDPNSMVVLVLGPITVGALVSALVWWLTHRPPEDGKPPKDGSKPNG